MNQNEIECQNVCDDNNKTPLNPAHAKQNATGVGEIFLIITILTIYSKNQSRVIIEHRIEKKNSSSINSSSFIRCFRGP